MCVRSVGSPGSVTSEPQSPFGLQAGTPPPAYSQEEPPPAADAAARMDTSSGTGGIGGDVQPITFQVGLGSAAATPCSDGLPGVRLRETAGQFRKLKLAGGC